MYMCVHGYACVKLNEESLKMTLLESELGMK